MDTLYHITPRRNLKSILRHGILAGKALGRRKAVWAVVKSMIPWALIHVTFRQACSLNSLMILKIRVPADRVKRHRGELRYIPADVPPGDIVEVRSIKEYSWR
jgi:hypothetical protein